MLGRVTWTLILGLALLGGLLWALGIHGSVALADPGILYVAPGGNCSGATPCYASVQAAVDAADGGDEIRVAGGTYVDIHDIAGTKQVVYVDKPLTLRGGYAPTDWSTPDPVAHPTTLDARNQGRVMVVTGGIDNEVQLEGLRITGGDATLLGPQSFDTGGGIYIHQATATIRNCEIFSNTTGTEPGGNGGGLHAGYSKLTMVDSIVRDNTVSLGGSGGGGGVYVTNSTITLWDNSIANNSAGYMGGGMLIFWSEASLRGNSFSGNVTTGTGSGAALYLYGVGGTLDANVFSGNVSVWNGGGLVMVHSPSYQGPPIELTNNVFADNQAEVYGTGLYIEASSPHMVNNTIARNAGGDMVGRNVAVYVTSDYGGYNMSSVDMTNTIMVGHTAGISVTQGSTVTLDSTLWYDTLANWEGGGTVQEQNSRSGAPLFAADGYHLIAGSAAIDSGVDAGVPLDIDGEVRPWGSGVDIGADEYGSALATPTATPSPTQTPTATATGTPGASPTPTPTTTPTAGCPDDRFEDNDSCASAAPVSAGSYPDLMVCRLDDDWFAAELGFGEALTVTISFDDDQGDLDMALWSGDCGGEIMASTSDGDMERVRVPAGGGGTYKFRVYGYFRAENTYDMQVDISSPEPAMYLPLVSRKR